MFSQAHLKITLKCKHSEKSITFDFTEFRILRYILHCSIIFGVRLENLKINKRVVLITVGGGGRGFFSKKLSGGWGGGGIRDLRVERFLFFNMVNLLQITLWDFSKKQIGKMWPKSSETLVKDKTPVQLQAWHITYKTSFYCWSRNKWLLLSSNIAPLMFDLCLYLKI